ncbi:hypothetical protein MKX01_016859 [Papaver californicum]|nr:hypothetical protein MKX01_016859 [Papaver californicum]
MILADIVFDYRQKATRTFEYLQGDYYIAPVFMDKVACHLVKNFIVNQLNVKVPLILGIWGGKGQGKSFRQNSFSRQRELNQLLCLQGS